MVKFHVALVTCSSDSVIVCFDSFSFAVSQLVAVCGHDVVAVAVAIADEAKRCVMYVIKKFATAPAHT